MWQSERAFARTSDAGIRRDSTASNAVFGDSLVEEHGGAESSKHPTQSYSTE